MNLIKIVMKHIANCFLHAAKIFLKGIVTIFLLANTVIVLFLIISRLAVTDS